MDDIKNIGDKFKDFADLKAYSDAQYKTIITLSKKVNELEKENVELRKNKSEAPKLIQLLTTDEETICRVQLQKLKDIALERELTYEEAKKTEIFSKIIITLKNKAEKDEQSQSKSLDEKELLKLIETNEQPI